MDIKVVLNSRYGGYGLSEKAIARLKELGVEDADVRSFWDERDNPLLVQVVEELGKKANTKYSDLRIGKVPYWAKDMWEVFDYDGIESAVVMLD